MKTYSGYAFSRNPSARANPIQFAVVREDPWLEVEVLRRRPCHRILTIASGGCTALTLRAIFPQLEITLLDPNPAQLDLVRRKITALQSLSGKERDCRFNVETDDPSGLSECGNFESLFRVLRGILYDLVLPYTEMRRLFTEAAFHAESRRLLFESPYWPVAFRMVFCDPLLNAMFGPDATQYAVRGSYPEYFQELFERGLSREDARGNPFLHHVLLGHYLDRPGCLPHFLTEQASNYHFEFLESFIDDSVNLARFDFIGLSNILDWMKPANATALMDKVRAETRPGAVVMWRQLNNDRDLQALLGGAFTFDHDLERDLKARDRSLFYSAVHVGVRAG